MRRDYYAVLGIAATAAPREIRQAYRRLARQYSPDVNFWDTAAGALFEEIAEAYRVLNDPDARSLYDLLARRAREAPLGEEGASGCQERAARRVRPVGLRAPVTLFTVDRHAAPNYTCGQPACNRGFAPTRRRRPR